MPEGGQMKTGQRVVEALRATSRNHNSYVGINFDPMPEGLKKLPKGETFETFIFETLKAIAPFSSLFKINTQHTILRFSARKVKEIVKEIHDYGLPVIADHKLSDFENSNRVGMHYLLQEMGFDGLTVHPIIGFKDGMDAIIEEAIKYDAAVFAVIHMSNDGAKDFYKLEIKDKGMPLYMRFTEAIVDWGLTGGVMGARFPDAINKVYNFIRTKGGKQLILSTGYGIQKGNLEAVSTEVMNAGFYAFYGRSVLYAYQNPKFSHLGFPAACVEAVKEFKDRVNRHFFGTLTR